MISNRDPESRFPALLHLVLALAFLPLVGMALAYSLRTPFRLIDDYSDWMNVRILDSWAGFWGWLKYSFFSTQGLRYRPFFYLYQGLAWKLFGPRPALLHAARWIFKFGAAWYFYRCLRLWLGARRGWLWLAFWPFAFLFFLFPNNPEARLSPQELFTIFFLALVNWQAARLLKRTQGDLSRAGLAELAGLLPAFLALCLFKENNFFASAMLMGFLGFGLRRRGLVRAGLVLLPFGLVQAYTMFRVWCADQGVHYAVVHPTFTSVLHDLAQALWLMAPFCQGFAAGAWTTALVLLALLGLGLAFAGPAGGALGLEAGFMPFYWMVWLEFWGLFASQGFAWSVVLRYLAPQVFLLACLVGLTLVLAAARFAGFPAFRRLALAGAAAGCVWFAGFEAFNYVDQFYVQYNSGLVENRALGSVESLLKAGRGVTIPFRADDEPSVKMVIYFRKFLPYFFHEDLPLSTSMPPRTPFCLDTGQAPPGWSRAAVFKRVDDSPWLAACRRLSGLFQGKPARRVCFWTDLSAYPAAEFPAWYLWERPAADPPSGRADAG